jgi:hypothetical protein
MNKCREGRTKYLDLVVVDREEIPFVEGVEGSGVDGAKELVLRVRVVGGVHGV